VRLITGSNASIESPVNTIVVADLSGNIAQQAADGHFEFAYWGGRTIRVVAFYDVENDGKVVHFFGRSQTLSLNNDIGPLTVTLDQHEGKE
jgi:hypothetical protein